MVGHDLAIVGDDVPSMTDATKTFNVSEAIESDRYRTVRLLGKGAFGTVYEGFDNQLQRSVAIKIPHADRRVSSEQFLQEMRLAARLQHPHIVTIHDAGVDRAGRMFAVFELISGRPMSEVVAAGPVQRATAVRWVAEAAEAAHAAHSAQPSGMVHRDIKPSNILIDRNGRARVSDFGLALDETMQADRIGEVAGSPAYMSPEQSRGDSHRLDGRTDVWSLGVILYEILTGRRPFVGKTLEDLRDEVETREPKPPRQIDDTIPRALETCVMRCMEKSVRDRYATAGDLAADLRTWLGSVSAVETPDIPRRESDSSRRGAPATAVPRQPAGDDLAVSTASEYREATSTLPPVVPSRKDRSVKRASSAIRVPTVVTAIVMLLGIGMAMSGVWQRWFAPAPPAKPPASPDGLQSLLAVRPTVLAWPRFPANDEWEHDPARQTLRVACKGIALLQLGETSASDFLLTVDVGQTPWIGGFGVFFGYREIEPAEDGGRRFRCQVIELHRNGGAAGPLNLGRSVWTLDAAGFVISREDSPSFPANLPALSDGTMSVRIRQGRMSGISFHDKVFPELVSEEEQLFVDERVEGTQGTFGVFVSAASAVFRKAGFNNLQERQP